MKFTSTRSNCEVDSLSTILQGLASDGGLYVPTTIPEPVSKDWSTLEKAERAALGTFFDDIPSDIREDAIKNLISKFPAEDPIPLVDADNFKILELFHGPTGAFKDVALSVLPVLMAAAAKKINGEKIKKVLILTATSGDTGSAAMAGFANVPGVEVAVFFPNTGTSRIQRLQMTTPSASNVHGIAIRGNFDDAQAAVKRIFSSPEMHAAAEAAGVTLSSANSINTGRLIPQIAYYLLSAAKLNGAEFDVVVPSGNFGNILAAYYAKLLGAPIKTLVLAANVNRVLDGFVTEGLYDPRPELVVTNSPSMDIRKSSNVERLLWLLNEGNPDAVNALFKELDESGVYHLQPNAIEELKKSFVSGFATEEETEEEMNRMYKACGYILDPHTAVATCVARKLGFPKNRPCVIAATATPYKFPETCNHAFGKDILDNPPKSFADLETARVTQTKVVDVNEIDDAVRALF
jgi:threonine synthase